MINVSRITLNGNNVASSNIITFNQMLNEMTTVLLADFDAETRFKVRAKRGKGKTKRGLDLLEKAMERSPS